MQNKGTDEDRGTKREACTRHGMEQPVGTDTLTQTVPPYRSW